MKLPRRHFLHLAAGAAALPAGARLAWAQAYPSRPVRLLVGFPAGGVTDVFARLMGQWLSERLGQAFVIENRMGAASNLSGSLGRPHLCFRAGCATERCGLSADGRQNR
jgi:tripartite-type tricarboxylate transporter receptor subunit TctC